MLRGAVRNYAWGSRTVIADLTGRPGPTEEPEAELWLGAHPGDPAWVDGEDGLRSLREELQRDARRHLGPRVEARFGGELPYLMKVIAVSSPLSLQAHPNAEQAKSGFLLEEWRSVPREAPDRNYRDPHHKPEMVVALTPFDALAGFRSVNQTRDLLVAWGITDDIDVNGVLATTASPAYVLSHLVASWLHAPHDLLVSTITRVRRAAHEQLQRADPLFVAEAATMVQLTELYPSDPGVLAALSLNRITLQPGEAIFLPAGNLHAYLHGAAVEVMSNSDNVLRGGLTPKHVDVAELLRVLDYTPVTPSALAPRSVAVGPRVAFEVGVDDFALTVWNIDGPLSQQVEVGEIDCGPQILLCTEGAVTVCDSSRSIDVRGGQAVWISAGDQPVKMDAHRPSQVFVARCPY